MNVLATSSEQSIKLLQLTDTHLFAPDDGHLLSVKTADSFHAVIAAILESQYDFDAILATGDISQDHSHESYKKFERGIMPLKKPCFWLPGNHDDQPQMGSIFPSEQIQSVQHVLLGEHWQMLLLDSQVMGVPHGRLSSEQLALLDNALRDYPNRYALVLLHHHPLLVGSAWLDQHSLKESDSFWQIVEQHQNVRAVLCGHIHQEMDRLRGDVRVLATPSTCVQFKPQSHDFALDRQSPGWRELDLHPDGTLHTQVKRLPRGHFLPDFNASGY